MKNFFFIFTLVLSEVCLQRPIRLFLYFVAVLSRYVAEVFSDWFWDGSICPYFYRYRFCFYATRALYFCCKVCIFSNLLWFVFLSHLLSPEIVTSINKHVPLLLSRIVMSVLLLGMVISVVICYGHLLVLKCGYLTLMTCSYHFGTC